MSDAPTQHQMNDPVIPIGILARKVGLSVSAVRRYENEGLIIAHRSSSRQRLFSLEDVNRVRNIRHLIEDLGLNVEGIRRMQAFLPCWNLHSCGVTSCKTCPAYQDGTRPCWMIKKLRCTPQEDKCRQCVVYRMGSLCTQDIKRLLYDQTRSWSADEAAGEMMQEKRHPEEEER